VPRTRVLLADDHAIVAQGLEALLKDTFELTGVVGDGKALIEAAEASRPDVIVTDISMPAMNGLDAAREVRRRGIPSRVIFLTMHMEPQLAAAAFAAGASGYLLKQSAGEELVTAIEEVARGKRYLTPLIPQDALDEAGERTATLTRRQSEVLQLIAAGFTMKETAARLNISSRTAESHKYDIMDALGVKTTPELIHHAVRLGLLHH